MRACACLFWAISWIFNITLVPWLSRTFGNSAFYAILILIPLTIAAMFFVNSFDIVKLNKGGKLNGKKS